MASRTKMLGVQYYDSDGGLDWCVHGDCLEWIRREIGKGRPVFEVREEILKKFHQALDFAFMVRDVGMTQENDGVVE